jgi:S-adenosylmethionine synthetase
VRETIKGVGYTRAKYGFDYETCAVISAIHEQSPDIAMGVDPGGAGDQGLMFGYACRETDELMPLPILLAHKLTRRLTQVRREELIDYLRPDGKSQVTVEYEGDQPVRVEAVIISAQHSDLVKIETIREDVLEKVIQAVVPPGLLDDKTKYYINPTGRFVVGGPQGDCGLTGRKIIVDTYGGVGSHGGGAFSGKDPTKVDRSASYMARHIAKNIVAAGLAERVELQIAYAIGVADPVSIMADTLGTGQVPEARIVSAIREVFPLTPAGIIKYLDLRRPIYKKTAAYGHFGRLEPEFTWEQTTRVGDLRAAAKL